MEIIHKKKYLCTFLLKDDNIFTKKNIKYEYEYFNILINL